MKTAKTQIILILIINNATLITAQNYHLIYETDIYSVSLKQAAEGKSESKYSISTDRLKFFKKVGLLP